MLTVTGDKVSGPYHTPAFALPRDFGVAGIQTVSLQERIDGCSGFTTFDWEGLCGAKGWLYNDCALTRRGGVCMECRIVLVRNEIRDKAAA